MTGAYLGYLNQNFLLTGNIIVNVPDSGFSIQFGKIGSWESPPYEPFTGVVSFSGYSGYIFDQNGNFVGGYFRGQPFSISCSAVYNTGEQNRLSYSLNNLLIANNIPLESGADIFFDSVLFNSYNGLNKLSLKLKIEEGSPVVLAGNTGLYLFSSDDYYLAGLSNTVSIF